jgi:hypothetical protein
MAAAIRSCRIKKKRRPHLQLLSHGLRLRRTSCRCAAAAAVTVGAVWGGRRRRGCKVVALEKGLLVMV